MTSFEKRACKALGVILFVVICALLLQISGCASTNKAGEVEMHYPLLDTRFKVHKYKENIQWLILPDSKQKTAYCSAHFEWEDIQPVYRPVGNGEYNWQYVVTKNKR